MIDQPTLLVLDSQGMEQLVDGDLEGDAAVLLEANLVPAAARSVRDDRVAAAVARDDVQIVGLSVAGLKSVTLKSMLVSISARVLVNQSVRVVYH